MNPEYLRWLAVACEALPAAYAPYSSYRVAAALCSDDGRLFPAVNVENSSYGLTICAERAAVFSAVAAGVRRFRGLALAASDAPLPLPCGACRQVLAEFAGDDLPVCCALAASPGEAALYRLGDLLPHAFRLPGRP